MKSPFLNYCFGSQVVDQEKFFQLQQMTTYVLRTLRYKYPLETTTSSNRIISIKRKSHIHMDYVGILMVYDKKPFRVRFLDK
jgi:hypothetical protein